MKSSSPNSSKSSLIVHDEEANILSFRRTNKFLILSLVFLIILLTLTISASIIHFLRIKAFKFPPFPDKPRLNPDLRAFCHVSSDVAACLTAVEPIISHKIVSDPNQIFTISLQAAAEDLQRLTASFAFSNCSNSLRHGLDQIRYPLEAMHVDPFVQSKSDEQRGEMMNRITAAEEDVDGCLDDLGEIGEAAELLKVKVYLNGAGDFLIGYAVALRRVETLEIVEDHGLRMRNLMEHFSISVLQWVFIIGLFCSLFRVKSRPKF